MPAGNTLATATNLTLNSASTLQVEDGVTRFNPDFYSFRVSAHSNLSLSLASNSYSSGSADVELLDSAGKPLTLDGIVQKSENSDPGLLDLININNLSAGLYYIRIYTTSTAYSPYDLPYRLNVTTTTDIHSDLIWRNYGNSSERGKTSLWTMNGTTPVQTIGLPNVADLNWRVEGTGDFNGDGQADLVWRNYGTSGADAGKVLIWTMNGNTPIQSVALPFPVPDPNWHIEAIGDFNSDRQTDLIWRNYGMSGTDAGKIMLWTMNGTTPIQSFMLPFSVPDINWRIEGTGDFNGDSKTDLVWRNYGTSGADAGKILIWTTSGTGVASLQAVALPFPVPDINWRIEGVNDFNGDGQTDLLWRNYGTSGADSGKVLIWMMNGTQPIQTVELPVSVPDATWQIEGIRERRDGFSTRIDSAGNSRNTALNLGYLASGGTFNEFVGNGDTDDYYEFRMDTTGNVQISLDNLTGDADLELLAFEYDPASNTTQLTSLRRSQNPGNTTELTFPRILERNSPYYIRVSAKNGENVNYRLRLSVLSATPRRILDLSGASLGNNYAATFVQGVGAVPVTDSSTLSITNGVSGTLTSATVTLSNYTPAPYLAVDTTGTGITANYNPATRELILSGVASVVDYQKVLRTVTYNSTTITPFEHGCLVEFVVNDGSFSSNIATTPLVIKPLLQTNVSINSSSLDVSYGTESVTTADFNNDGNLDLAFIAGTNNLSIRLGNGDGTFTNAPDVSISPTYNNPPIITGDFNNDGNIDVIIEAEPGYLSNSMSVRLGNGDGTFREAPNLRIAQGDNHIVTLGDFNGDSNLDLAIAGRNFIMIRLGNGDGTFISTTDVPLNYYPGSSPISIVSGDFNNDGKLDLVTTDGYPNSMDVLLGNGDGTFDVTSTQILRQFTFGTLSSIKAEDINHDNRLDLILLYQDAFETVLGNGDGTFSIATPRFAGGPSVKIQGLQDLNNDGKFDVITVPSSSRLDVYFNDGNDFFPNLSYSFEGEYFYYADDITFEDFNNDNNPDLVIVKNRKITLFPNQSPNQQVFTPPGTLAVEIAPSATATGDFNGDGVVDTVVTNSGSDSVSVLLSDGKGKVRNAVSYSVGANPSSIALGDFNRDGKLDLVVTNQSSNTISLLLGNGNGTFQTAINYAAGLSPSSIKVDDFNRDGNLDLAIANSTSNTISILLGNTGGTFQPAVSYSVGTDPRSIAIDDLNGDHQLDLVVGNYGSGNVSLLLGNGNGTFQSAVSIALGAALSSVAIADLNGDSNLDLIVTNSTSNNVSALLGNGNGTFQAAVSYATGLSPTSVITGDFNGDGKLDLVTASNSYSSNTVSMLLGNGNGTFQSAFGLLTESVPVALSAGDFNSDGYLDLVVASNQTNRVSFLLNQLPKRS